MFCPVLPLPGVFTLQKSHELLVAGGVVILFFAGLLLAVNTGYFIKPEPANDNNVFSEEHMLKGDSIAFRLIPVNNTATTYIVSYEVRGEGPNVTGGWSVAERKFEAVSKTNPIEILVPRVARTTYTLSILISDQNQNMIYRGTSTITPDTEVSLLPVFQL